MGRGMAGFLWAGEAVLPDLAAFFGLRAASMPPPGGEVRSGSVLRVASGDLGRSRWAGVTGVVSYPGFAAGDAIRGGLISGVISRGHGEYLPERFQRRCLRQKEQVPPGTQPTTGLTASNPVLKLRQRLLHSGAA